jgi:hypothetical protein
MTRLFSSAFTLLSLLAWTPAFAAGDCSCDSKCAHECEIGKVNTSCACKTCGCAKGEGCKHGKCAKGKTKSQSEMQP